MELQDYRRELDTLDDGLLELFCRRMEIAAKIGAYKKEKGLPGASFPSSWSSAGAARTA